MLAMFEAARVEFRSVVFSSQQCRPAVDAPFAEMTRAQWQKVIDVNLTGRFLCAREAVREFNVTACDRRSRAPPERLSALAQCTR